MKSDEIRNTKYEIRDNPKVVIVHDWLYGGGAERVVYELHRLYPNAPIYASYCSDEWRERLDNKVITGYLQRFGKLRKYLPLLQYWWFKRLDLSGYDLIISSSGNGMAKAVTKPAGAVHINYCHTPVHYLWRHYSRYIERPGFGVFDPIARIGLKMLLRPLQKADYIAAQKVDYFIANSTHIQSDIKTYYNRESTIIFPPVQTSRFAHVTAAAPSAFKQQQKGTQANSSSLSSAFQLPSSKMETGFITVGRLAPMKRTDLIVQACTRLNVPLTVIGIGPDYEKLQVLAGPTVRLLGKVSDQEVVQELSKAEAFLFASFEDFGITPVEAMAAGLPVIAYGKGGALDYVNKDTGILFPEQTVDSLINGIRAYQNKTWSSQKIAQAAQKFSNESFAKAVHGFINNPPNLH